MLESNPILTDIRPFLRIEFRIPCLIWDCARLNSYVLTSDERKERKEETKQNKTKNVCCETMDRQVSLGNISILLLFFRVELSIFELVMLVFPFDMIYTE